jgi:hypothetical protein
MTKGQTSSMDLESCSIASSQLQVHSSDLVSSVSRVSRLFGRNCRTWDRDELEEVLDFFQVDHSQAKQKAKLFDLSHDKVVHDWRVDESAIPVPQLLRFIHGDNSAVSQPLIDVKPKENDFESDIRNRTTLNRKYAMALNHRGVCLLKHDLFRLSATAYPESA